MITEIMGTIGFEVRLYLKSRNFWLAAFLVNVYAWTAFFLAGQVMSGVAQIFIPVLLFLAAEVVTKDKREDFTEIINALPYNSSFLLIGRALAVLFWFMLLGMELLLTMLLAAKTALPVYISWSACLAFMVKYFLVCINVIGITFLVASVTKNSVRLYSILFFWWLIGIFLTGNTGILFPQWTAIVNFTFIHGFGGNPSEVIGVYPYEKMITLIIFFQITCSILLFIIGVIIENARRGPREGMVKNGLLQVCSCITILVVIFFATLQNFDIESKGNKEVLADSQNRVLPTAVNRSVQSNILPAAYDLYITLDSDTHNMMVRAQVTLKNLGDTSPSIAEFTLRDYLHVKKISNVATGQVLAWQQQGPYLTVSLPQDPLAETGLLTLEINYSGTVWEWSKDLYGQATGIVNVVASPFTCLRGGYAWYPSLGRQPLYTTASYFHPWNREPKQVEQNLLVSHIPVPFKMTVDSHEDLTFISNIELTDKLRVGDLQRHKFISQGARDVFLLAGPYEHTKVEVSGREKLVDFYHFTKHDYNLKNLAYKVNQIDYYSSLIPRRNNISDIEAERDYLIFEAPRFLTYDNLMNTSNLGFIDSIAIPEAIFLTKALHSPWWSQPAGRILSEARSLNLWWPNCFSKEKGDIADGLALYMYVLYNENKHGKKFYSSAREYWQFYNDESPENPEMLGQRGRVVREVFLLMDRIRQSHLGDDGVKLFLCIINASYQDKRVIELADIVTALELISVLDNPNVERSAVEVKYRDAINNLSHLLANPPENRARGNLMFKLTWDFGTQIKAKEAQ